jgi:XRE family transcriptional regulator, regulator of sulfur utilization
MRHADTVAENLRRIRTARGLSLSDLARRAGVAKATLVGLEAGRGNPTIGTLAAIADELGVAVERLVSDAAPPVLHVGRARDGAVIRGAGADVRFLHRSAAGGAMLELYALTVRARHVSPPHPAGVLEQIAVTRGRLAVEVGDEHVVLTTGDVVAFSADRPHAYEPIGDGRAEGIMVMTYPEVPAPIWTSAGERQPPATAP